MKNDGRVINRGDDAHRRGITSLARHSCCTGRRGLEVPTLNVCVQTQLELKSMCVKHALLQNYKSSLLADHGITRSYTN